MSINGIKKKKKKKTQSIFVSLKMWIKLLRLWQVFIYREQMIRTSLVVGVDSYFPLQNVNLTISKFLLLIKSCTIAIYWYL